MFSLLFLKLSSDWFHFVEYCKVLIRYYKIIPFARADLSLLTKYIFSNPYRINKNFLRKRGESKIYAYGETPLTVLEEICKRCDIGSDDIIYELGSGRGRTCFWMNMVLGAKVVGIEFVPDFVSKANDVIKKYELEGISFLCRDFTDVSFDKATVLYLYGTCLEDAEIRKLIKKIVQLPPGTKIISVSYPLADYCEEEELEVMNHFSLSFPWGIGDVFYQIKK